MDRLDEVEIKIAYHDRTLEELHEALVEKEKRIVALEESVDRLERALRLLAQRTRDTGEVAGAHPEEDPVPRSG